MQGMGVIRKQHQRGQTCRANRIALGHRLGGIAHRIEWVSDVTHAIGKLSHFSNTTRVVRDRAISIKCDDNARHGQHRSRCHSNTEQTSQRIGRQNTDAHTQNRPCSGLHRNTDTGNDVGCMTCGRCLSDMFDWREVCPSVVLGDPHHRGRQHKTDHAGTEQSHRRHHSSVRHRDGFREQHGCHEIKRNQ